MNISEPFIRRPVATTLLMLGLLFVGLIAYRQLPVAALPQVDYPTIVVSTYSPGASAQTMAESVTTPLERQLGQVPSLAQMMSISSYGNSQITLQFVLDRNIDAAEQDVQAAINAASNLLPATLPTPPTYSKSNPADAPVLTLAISSKTLPLTAVNDTADSVLAQKIAQVAGVGIVTMSGSQKPAVRVQVDPTALAGSGLSLEDLRAAIAAANINQAKGSVSGRRQEYTIATSDQLTSAAAFRPTIVAYRNGGVVRLVDVADVVDGVENAQLAAWANGERAIILNVLRQPGANVIQVASRIKELLPKLEAALPQSIDVKVLSDRTETVRASVDDVQFTLVLTVVLVVLVIFAFLRNVRATLIPSVTVPLSLVGTFGIMYVAGYSLNNLSLMALTIATGFVVDDAIVMIENIERHIEHGKAPMEAALEGAEEIGFTIVSLTVSLVAVLIPLLFMTGIIGRLFREFAVTLAASIIVSALLSLTLTAMMCAHLLRPRPSAVTRGVAYRLSEGAFDAMLVAYDRTLGVVLAHRRITLAVAILTLGLTALLAWVVPKGFFPTEDTGLIMAMTEAPPDVSFPRMMTLQESVADVILADPGVESVASFIGADATNTTANTGRLSITLKAREHRDDAEAIIARLRPKLASLASVSTFLQSVQDLQVDARASRTPYQFTIEDAHEEELGLWAPRIIERLATRPELRDLTSDLGADGRGVMLTIDRDTATRLGVSAQAIDDVLYDAFGQRQVSMIFTQLNLYRVVLEVKPEFQKNPDALRLLYVSSSTGAQIPLSTFVHMQPSRAPLAINRQGQFAAATLSFDVNQGHSLGEAVDAIHEELSSLDLPPGLHGEFQGTAQAFRDALASEPALVLAALITVYIVLGVLYESLIHPITILSTLPSAGIGALLALLVTKTEFTVIALVGVVLLIGIVKKNAIMMIDFALEAERTEGLAPTEAIYKACLLRFRPIMMTTMAALLGGVPLAIGTGAGAELRRPLGITIVGGLIVSQVLTLYTTPVVYLYMERVGRWASRSRRRPFVDRGREPGTS